MYKIHTAQDNAVFKIIHFNESFNLGFLEKEMQLDFKY